MSREASSIISSREAALTIMPPTQYRSQPLTSTSDGFGDSIWQQDLIRYCFLFISQSTTFHMFDYGHINVWLCELCLIPPGIWYTWKRIICTLDYCARCFLFPQIHSPPFFTLLWPWEITAWTLQWSPLALQLMVRVSQCEAPDEIRRRRRNGVFAPLDALLLGHEVQWLWSSLKGHSSCQMAFPRALVTVLGRFQYLLPSSILSGLWITNVLGYLKYKIQLQDIKHLKTI